MATKRKRVLALAACTGAIAWVFLIDDRVKARKLSRKMWATPLHARSFTRLAVAQYEPDVVVLENPDGRTRKRGKTIQNLQLIVRDLEDQGVPHVLVEKRKMHPNKHEEALAIAKSCPELSVELRPRALTWQTEPKSLLYFEAVGLACESGALDCSTRFQ